MDQVLIKESRLENHMDRCRCCLKKFEADSQTVQLTILIEKLFYDFTQIEVKITIIKHTLTSITKQIFFYKAEKQ